MCSSDLHDLYTNGISYINLAFPLDILPPDDYPWFPFFARAALSVGLPDMNYADVSSLLARTVGGFAASLLTGSAVSSNDDPVIVTPSGEYNLAGRDWIVYRLKCLDEQTAPSLDIALRLISEANYSDTRRIRDLVLEMKNAFRSSLAPAGHGYASGRAGRFSSLSTQTGEIWNGLTQLAFVHRLAEMDIDEVAAKLHSLREKIISGGFVASLAGSADALRSGGSLLAQRFSRFGPPRPRTAGTPPAPEAVCEVFASPTMQIGFAAMALRAAAFDTVEQVAETVLAHQLSTGALWEDIRMKGGAYGAFASSDGIERCFSLATYRDPNPLRSLDTFSSVLKASDLLAKDDLEKMIIGCYARETRPRTPSEKDFADFFRYLSRIDDGSRRRRLERLIHIAPKDIAAALGELAQQKPAGKVLITGMKDAEQAAKTLGVEVQVLPV